MVCARAAVPLVESSLTIIGAHPVGCKALRAAVVVVPGHENDMADSWLFFRFEWPAATHCVCDSVGSIC